MTWLSQIRHHLFKIHMQQTGLSDYHMVINTFLKPNLWKLWPKIIHYRSYKNFDGSSRQEVFCKKGILRNFAKFPGKHLCQSLFFNKVAGLCLKNWKLYWAPTTIEFNLFCWNFAHVFYITMSKKGCSWFILFCLDLELLILK